MANDVSITIVGNLVSDPEVRFLPNGSGVCTFTVASTPRVFDKNANAWSDGDPLFMRCSAWRELGENAGECLSKGMRVIVSGRLKQRSFETREGEKRTVVELDVEAVGPDLRYATAVVTKVSGSGGNARATVGAGARGGNGRGFSNQHDDSDAPF